MWQSRNSDSQPNTSSLVQRWPLLTVTTSSALRYAASLIFPPWAFALSIPLSTLVYNMTNSQASEMGTLGSRFRHSLPCYSISCVPNPDLFMGSTGTKWNQVDDLRPLLESWTWYIKINPQHYCAVFKNTWVTLWWNSIFNQAKFTQSFPLARKSGSQKQSIWHRTKPDANSYRKWKMKS